MNRTLASAAIFHGLPPGAVDAVAGQLRTAHFPAGHVFFAEGDPGDSLFIIVSGKVKLGSHTEGGHKHLLSMMGPSDMFGELSLFDPGPRTSTAIALTAVTAATMDRDVLRLWLTERPEITQRLLRVLARRLRRTDDHLSDLIFTDVAGRVAKQLLALAQRFGEREGDAMRVTHDLTQKELAQMVGATRETVNKALTDFSQRGWIRMRGKSVLILDAARLARRAR